MRKTIFYALIAALGGFLFGFDTAVINGALPFFRDHFELSGSMEGWAVSSALVGCIVGAIFIGKPGDMFGRRNMLIVMASFFLISAIGSGLANSVFSFIIFRIIGGIGVGGASVLSPMYISEIAPPKLRGRFTMSFQLAIVIGVLTAFFSDYLLIGVGKNNWRWMFIVEAIPALMFFVPLFFVARSPRWLVVKGRMSEARSVIEKLNPEENSDNLLKEIQQSINEEVVQHFRYLFKKPYLRLVLVGIAVGMFNQFTGINIIMYYSTDIFRAAHFTTESAIMQTVIIGVINLAFTILAMYLIDRIGRKFMLLFGALGMTLFLAGFAYAFLNEIKGFVLLGMLLGFVAFFAFSQGAVIWVLLSEMFPNNIRARGSSIGTFSHWFFNGSMVFLFPVVVKALGGAEGHGIGYIFIFYALATFISFFFFKKYLIETKGQSLEELEKHMLKD